MEKVTLLGIANEERQARYPAFSGTRSQEMLQTWEEISPIFHIIRSRRASASPEMARMDARLAV